MHFASDNSGPALPQVMQAMAKANDGFAMAYGADAIMDEVVPAATYDSFTLDLNNPLRIEEIRQFGARYVQWDVLFDTTFRTQQNDAPPGLSPSTPLPELHFMRLPIRL